MQNHKKKSPDRLITGNKFQGKTNIIIISILAIIIVLVIISVKKRILKPPKSKKTPNIIIIVMDTVRQDHLSCYGYRRNTSPNLTELTKNSRIYYNAYSTSGWTPPAHASLFTGLYPGAHKTTQENWTLSEDLNTIAEILLIKGFETFGISENPLISKRHNFDQGFQHFCEAWQMGSYYLQSVENSAFLAYKEILNQRDKEKPFFLFINLIEPHSPYDSSRFFSQRFLSDKSFKLRGNRFIDHFLGNIKFSPKHFKHLIELYDAEILYVDYLIGRIISDLKKRKIWNDTVFIVTSDHGENFGEHNLVDHMFSLNQALIKIPLIIHYPRLFKKNSKDYGFVQINDLFPTILNITESEGDRYFSHGQNLLDKKSRENRIVFSEYYYPVQVLHAFRTNTSQSLERIDKYKRRIKSIISKNIKLIWGSDEKHELYDLNKDPAEEKNLVLDRNYSDIMQKLLKRVKMIVNKNKNESSIKPPKVKKAIDEKTKRALKSLGYL